MRAHTHNRIPYGFTGDTCAASVRSIHSPSTARSLLEVVLDERALLEPGHLGPVLV